MEQEYTDEGFQLTVHGRVVSESITTKELDIGEISISTVGDGLLINDKITILGDVAQLALGPNTTDNSVLENVYTDREVQLRSTGEFAEVLQSWNYDTLQTLIPLSINTTAPLIIGEPDPATATSISYIQIENTDADGIVISPGSSLIISDSDDGQMKIVNSSGSYAISGIQPWCSIYNIAPAITTMTAGDFTRIATAFQSSSSGFTVPGTQASAEIESSKLLKIDYTLAINSTVPTTIMCALARNPTVVGGILTSPELGGTSVQFIGSDAVLSGSWMGSVAANDVFELFMSSNDVADFDVSRCQVIFTSFTNAVD